MSAPVFVPSVVPCQECEEQAIGHLDEDWAVPCEAGFVCRHAPQPAEWVVHLAPCCGKRPPTEMWCTACKDIVISADNAVCNHCDQRWEPASTTLRLIEPLNRRTT